MLVQLANKIYDTGQIPNQIQVYTFAKIPKKPGALEYSKHRTISVMSHLGNIVLRFILNRFRNKIRTKIPEVRYGFDRNRKCPLPAADDE